MKKNLLLGMLMFAGITASAQLPSGSMAPDFTAVDINGNTHTLSEYLAQGKTVILDVSATWCGPCWNFHQSHALSDLHNSYGPWGSEEVVVLFVEGDPATTIDNLNGLNVQGTPPTQGNWVEGSTYPIIDSAELGDLYQIAYFPTVYRICPNGIVTEIEPMLAADLAADINTGCGELEGAQNHAHLTASEARVCADGGSTSVKVNLKNYGKNAITNGTVVIKEGDNVVTTMPFEGTIAPYESANITIDPTVFNPSSDYTVELADVNASAPFSWWMNKQDLLVKQAPETPNNVDVRIYTDNYPSEISWNLKDSEGNIVYTGGPYEPGTDDEWGGGGPDANTTKSHLITLPEGIECYSIELLDEFGDGWGLGNTTHGVELFTSEGSQGFIPVGNFGESMQVDGFLTTNGTLGTPSVVAANNFSIYPNPSNGTFNFATQEPVDVTVMDLTGKVVHTAKAVNDGGSMNLSSLQKGMYIAKINGANSERIEKLIIK